MYIQKLRVLWNKYYVLSLSLYLSTGAATYIGLYIKDFELDDKRKQIVKNMFSKVDLDIDQHPILYRLGKVYVLSQFFDPPRVGLTLIVVYLYARSRKKITSFNQIFSKK